MVWLRASILMWAFLLAVPGARAQTSPAPAVDPAQPASRAEWMRAAWSKMAHLSAIPPESVDESGTFEVEVSITVHRDGSVTASRLKKSSGKPPLDDHALRLVTLASPLPRLPPDMGEVERLTMPVAYDFGALPWEIRRDRRRRAYASQN